MNILIDFNHPAHIHLFKHFIKHCKEMGHSFLLTARDKDCSFNLLDELGLDYIKRTGYKGLGKAKGIISINHFLYKNARIFKPNILIGGVGNAYIAHTAFLLRKPSFIFDDTEYSKLQNLITFPFAKHIITPSCFTLDLGRKQILHNSYHELAYLHPDRFKADRTISDIIDINSPYAVIRFVDMQASHEIRDHGIRDRIAFIKELSRYIRVYISSEMRLCNDLDGYRINLKPSQIHDLMAFSMLYMGESATMASESAVLGIPAILISNSSRGYIKDLSRYGLVHHFKDDKTAIEKAVQLIKDNNTPFNYKKKRRAMLEDKIDLSSWMIDFFSNICQ